jgi:hypothetical protein
MAPRTRGGPVLLAASLLVAFLPAGCGGTGTGTGAGSGAGSGSPANVTATVGGRGAGSTDQATGGSVTATPGTPGSTSGSGSGSTSTGAGGPTATHTTAQSQAMFSSPSKNIACWMEGVDVRCDIAQHSWTSPPKPASCDLDYGNGLSLHAGTAQVVCAGDTVLGQTTILPYGEAISVGTDVCMSLAAGMRCLNLLSRHGFMLSRESYSLF